MSEALEMAQEEAKPDMTPMIDVVFLMIIFFICIDFKVLESKLDAFLPKDRGSSNDIVEPIEQLSVKVHVEAAGTAEYRDGTIKPNGAPARINPNSDPKAPRPERYAIKNHKVRWEVGPTPVATLEAVKKELERVAALPTSKVLDKKTNERKLMAVVIEAYPGACYDDVAKTADAANEAGFKEINFGGGLEARK